MHDEWERRYHATLFLVIIHKLFCFFLTCRTRAWLKFSFIGCICRDKVLNSSCVVFIFFIFLKCRRSYFPLTVSALHVLAPVSSPSLCAIGKACLWFLSRAVLLDSAPLFALRLSGRLCWWATMKLRFVLLHWNLLWIVQVWWLILLAKSYKIWSPCWNKVQALLHYKQVWSSCMVKHELRSLWESSDPISVKCVICL